MKLKRHEVELLEGLLKNDAFMVILDALAAHRRAYTLNVMISAHNVQNAQAAALAAAEMNTVECLPQLFLDLLHSQSEQAANQ